MSLSRNQILNWMKSIDIEGKNCFDIGCGMPEKWAKNFVKGNPKSYTTFDFNPEFGDYSIDLNESLCHQHIPIDLIKINQITFCIEVLEHIWNPVQVIKNLSEITNEVCYISSPFLNPIHEKCNDFLRFTDEWYLKVIPKFFSKCNIKYRMATSGLDDLKSFYSKEGLRMSKCRLKNGESWKIGLIGIIVEAYK